MTVNTLNITSGPYLGNDVADTFDYGFRIDLKEQLSVFETDSDGNETELMVDTDYTVSGIGDPDGGQVLRLAGPLPIGSSWYIRSDYKATQVTAFQSQGGFLPQVHERAFDKLTFLIQQVLDSLGRSLRLSDSDQAGSTALNPVKIKPSTVLGFNSDGELGNIPFSESGGVTNAGEIFDDTRLQNVQESLDDDKAAITANATAITANATAITANATAITANATAIQANADELDNVAPNPQCTITGTANALIATPGGTTGALVDGLRIRGRIPNDNTAAATLDYDDGGPLAISNSSTGFLKAGLNCEFEYTSSSNDWRILNSDLYWDDSIKEGFTISNAEITQIYQGTANSDADTTLTHPVAFPNVATYASGNFVSGGNLVSDAYFAVRNPTLTTVRVQSGAEDNETVRVIVRGY